MTLRRRSERPRIYLDNAATSWPKPDGVYAAVDRLSARARRAGRPQRLCRGGRRRAALVDDVPPRDRRADRRCDDPQQLIFTANGTDALNLAIHGSAAAGRSRGHDASSSTTRCCGRCDHLEDAGQITVTRVACDAAGVVDPDDVRAAVRPDTRLGRADARLERHRRDPTDRRRGPIARTARRAVSVRRGPDRSGIVPLDSRATANVDLLAAPGHKGLLGPLGTGVLVRPRGIEDRCAQRPPGRHRQPQRRGSPARRPARQVRGGQSQRAGHRRPGGRRGVAHAAPASTTCGGMTRS